MLTLAFFFCNEFLVSSFGKGKSKYPSQCSLHLFPSFMSTYCVSQNEVPCFNLCGRVEAMLCHVVWDEMSDRIDSHSQTPRIRQCSCSLCISSPRKSTLHKAKGLCTHQRPQDIISPYCVSALPMLLRRPSESP